MGTGQEIVGLISVKRFTYYTFRLPALARRTPMRRMDRTQLKMYPLADRTNKLDIGEVALAPDRRPAEIPAAEEARIERTADRIRRARQNNRPVMLTFGAHLVKNGIGPLIARMIEDGWLTHVATNGAGSIHDWEFAFQGLSGEDVRENVAAGKFGTWEETGRFLNLAIAVGGAHGLGYGQSVGRLIADDGLMVPSRYSLRRELIRVAAEDSVEEDAGAIADLLSLVTTFNIPAGKMEISHPFRASSIQYAAYAQEIPFTVHPGIGYDIIYTHPMNNGGAIGRGAVRDFLSFADTICHLEGGVHLSVGSAIMAPMVFEKALSMANNLALRAGRALANYSLVVNDIQDGGNWDWSRGEPPQDNPAYYLRFCKSFYRMGGELDYICLDNRAFLLGLYRALER